jgi:hypothetical protein
MFGRWSLGLVFLFQCSIGHAEDAVFEPLKEPQFSAFHPSRGEWFYTNHVEIDPQNNRKLKAVPADGLIIVNGSGKTKNLVSIRRFGDCVFACEFFIPKGSNSGIKMHGHYEIQIFDSLSATKLTGKDCGGIYPRAELTPRYRHIDEGIAPKVNACKAPGEWQSLEIIFRAPRFDSAGKRTEKAQFVRVTLNNKVIHDHVALDWPTGHAWHNKEIAKGPILIQADHGPVAFRNITIREGITP